MCLTTEALALFLSMIGADIITPGDTRITVHATEGDVHWQIVEDRWCTNAPKAERAEPSREAATQAG